MTDGGEGSDSQADWEGLLRAFVFDVGVRGLGYSERLLSKFAVVLVLRFKPSILSFGKLASIAARFGLNDTQFEQVVDEVVRVLAQEFRGAGFPVPADDCALQTWYELRRRERLQELRIALVQEVDKTLRYRVSTALVSPAELVRRAEVCRVLKMSFTERRAYYAAR